MENGAGHGEVIWWYTCTLCNRAFSEDTLLKAHKRLEHGSTSGANVLILSEDPDLAPVVNLRRIHRVAPGAKRGRGRPAAAGKSKMTKSRTPAAAAGLRLSDESFVSVVKLIPCGRRKPGGQSEALLDPSISGPPAKKVAKIGQPEAPHPLNSAPEAPASIQIKEEEEVSYTIDLVDLDLDQDTSDPILEVETDHESLIDPLTGEIPAPAPSKPKAIANSNASKPASLINKERYSEGEVLASCQYCTIPITKQIVAIEIDVGGDSTRCSTTAVQYYCGLCGAPRKYLSEVKKHIRQTHDHHPSACIVCHVLYQSLGNLRRHMQNQHKVGVDIWSCLGCETMFSKEDELKAHVAEGGMGRMCDRARPANVGVLANIALAILGGGGAGGTQAKAGGSSRGAVTGGGAGLFPCPHCDKTFPRKERLDGHLNEAHSKSLIM